MWLVDSPLTAFAYPFVLAKICRRTFHQNNATKRAKCCSFSSSVRAKSDRPERRRNAAHAMRMHRSTLCLSLYFLFIHVYFAALCALYGMRAWRQWINNDEKRGDASRAQPVSGDHCGPAFGTDDMSYIKEFSPETMKNFHVQNGKGVLCVKNHRE